MRRRLTMRNLVVEDRNKGRIIAKGHIDEAGKVHIDRCDGALDAKALQEVTEQIQKDVSEGFNGGRLEIKGLEWFEPFEA